MPAAEPLSRKDVTLLAQSITEAGRMKPFGLRAKRIDRLLSIPQANRRMARRLQIYARAGARKASA